MWTIALSGPASKRASAELALENARIPVYPDDHHAPLNWRSHFPDDPDEWLTVEHDDIDHVARVAETVGWRLRVHYETPDAPKPSEAQLLRATLDEMRARIAALEGTR